jgi:ribosomal protein L32E
MVRGLHELSIDDWTRFTMVKDWWRYLITTTNTMRKAVASVLMLMSVNYGMKEMSRVFCNKSVMPSVIMTKIKEEAGNI